jgi:predicted RNase H-like HicB family nuclease
MNDDRYLVILERGSDGSFSAYLPDVPGCVSCGDTVEEAQVMIGEALQLHFDGMQSAGLPIAPPTAIAFYVAAPPN